MLECLDVAERDFLEAVEILTKLGIRVGLLKKDKDPGETLSSEGEAGPKGQARAEVSVLYTV